LQRFIYKQNIYFPLRVIAVAIVLLCIFHIYSFGLQTETIFITLFSILVFFVRSGFVIDSDQLIVSRVIFFGGLSLRWAKHNLPGTIKYISIKKRVVVLTQKHNLKSGLKVPLRKMGYNVMLNFNKKGSLDLIYFFDREKAVKTAKAIAEHFIVEFENPGSN
jgi:hypothetical protein